MGLMLMHYGKYAMEIMNVLAQFRICSNYNNKNKEKVGKFGKDYKIEAR